MNLEKIFNGMIVVLNDLDDAEFYSVYSINDTIVTLKSVNVTCEVSLTEAHYKMLQKPNIKQIKFYTK